MSTKGILKAGNKIQTNLTGASDYDLKVGGVSVSSATSSITLGPYDDDQFYELTVNGGSVSVSCYDALINSVTPSVTLANLGSAQSAGAGSFRLIDSVKLAISTPSGWSTLPSIAPYPRTSAGINSAITAGLLVSTHVVLAFEPVDYVIDSDIIVAQNVSYIGHKPKITYTGDIPDADFTITGGTRFILSAGVTGFAAHNIALASEPENLTSTAIDGVKMFGITFVGGKRAIHSGAVNTLGFVHGDFDELYGIDQSADFSFIFDNFQHCRFGKIWSSSSLQSGGGVRFGNSLSSTLLPGNSTFENEIYTYSKNILNKSIEFVCDYSGTGAVLNELKVSGRLQGNRYGSATPASVSMTTTASSPSIVVSDSTQFSYMKIGMPVCFNSAPSGISAKVIYFVLSRNEATNTITIGESHYTSAVTPTSSGTYTAYCSGWPSLTVKATAGNNIANSDFGMADLEAYGNVCAIYAANVTASAMFIGEVMSSYTGTAIARRNCTLGLTHAGSTALTEDLSGSYNPVGSTTNLSGGPYPYSGGSFTLNSSHSGMSYRYTGTAAIVITVPLGLPKGFRFDIENDSTGSVTFVVASGGAIRSVSGYLKVTTQYGLGSLKNIANNVYHLHGDLSA